MTSIAIDPGPLTDHDVYIAEIIRFSDWVKGSPPKTEGGEVLLPGEVEHRNRAQRGRDGFAIDDETWQQIVTTAESVGVSRQELERLAEVELRSN